ncbi:hypothetical protein E4U54_007314 [Claviceps lovelessii]|nr:hypothetical protein E4U54_007314 [Claviceps lovelessii]
MAKSSFASITAMYISMHDWEEVVKIDAARKEETERSPRHGISDAPSIDEAWKILLRGAIMLKDFEIR